MCGIWALLSQVDITQLGKLFESFMKIKHRGPEYTRFDVINSKTILGFHRLAIMDLTPEGNQPFQYVRDDGSCVYCVCNGEIYDYKKLKQEYNIQTKSNSDCAIIIPLYEKVGIDKMIRLLGSEFAFIIYDISKNGVVKMFAGRDPIGVRPLFWGLNDESICLSSELKGLNDIYDKCYVFPPGQYMSYIYGKMEFVEYYKYEYKEIVVNDIEEVYSQIREKFINAVRLRTMADRPFGALLSGGVDSSLICGILKYLMPDKTFPVFTISFKSGSLDLPYAKQVAEYLNLKHHIIEIDEEIALSAIPETIRTIGSFDITSVRASTMQYLACQYIQKHTNIRVLFVGELSDECHASYWYFHSAPSAHQAKEEAIRLVKDVHRFDGLRTCRTSSNFGIEVRLPYAEYSYLDYFLSLPAELIAPINGIEKYTIRKAFEPMKLIPDKILYRHKTALSDGTTLKERSWYQIIQEHVDKIISDEEFEHNKNKFKHCPPFTKESYYYRKIFNEYYGNSEEVARTIPYFWMPKWVQTNDPSARTISTLKE